MRSARVAKAWFGLTALVVLAGMTIALAVAAGNEDGYFTTAPARVFNVFCFFTIQSNIIVGVTSGMLTVNPARSSPVFRVFRFAGLVAIAVTGVVYHRFLAGVEDFTGWGTVQTQLLHTVSPILYVVGWLLFGPRGLTSPRIVGLATIFPILWVVFTLIRGPIVDWYPYPFVDVIDLGYARVLLNIVGIAAAYIAIGFGAHALDQFLARRTTQSAALPNG